MKKFINPKDTLDYLQNEAKRGEEVTLDEKATATHPRRVNYFKNKKMKKENKFRNKVKRKEFEYKESVEEFTGLVFHCPNCNECFHLHIADVKIEK